MPEPTPVSATDAETASRGFEPLHLSWWMLSSPITFAALSSMLAFLLALGMGVEQGAGLKMLLSTHGFATVRAIQGFGLDQVLTGWATQLVVLLLCLNTLGLFLRYGRGREGSFGASRVAGLLPVSIDTLADQARGLTGGRGMRWDSERRRVRLRQGFARESMFMMALGLLTLVISLLVWDRMALDARMTVVPGETGGQAQMKVREGDHWVERQLPMALVCDRADPADSQRRRRCQARTSEWEGEFVVGAAREDGVAGYRIRALGETPRAGQEGEEIVLLMRRDEEDPRAQLKGQSGKSYRLSGGEELSLFSGPHGPLVVVKTSDGASTLMAPRLTSTKPVKAGPLVLEAVPSWSVVMAVEGQPHRYLMWAGLLMLLLGLVMLCRPAATVRFSATAAGTEVVIDSVNRAELPAKLLEALKRTCGGDA